MSILDELTRKVNEQSARNSKSRCFSENDYFQVNHQPAFSVLDFWRYMYSQIGAYPAELAEFLVARALGVKRPENLDYWSAYDMSYRGRRIEVKETRYIHSWNKDKLSNVRTFSIAPTNNRYWGSTLNLHPERKIARQSDVYVFCLNINKEYEKSDPLNIDYWRFYIVPTFEIDRYAEKHKNPDQKKISLNVVRNLAGEGVCFDEIREKVDGAIQKVDQYLQLIKE